jgi:predicted RNA-binding protein YlxR (DUF448 family)
VDPAELIRWVRDDEGAVVPDLSGRSFGRGAWVHPTKECLAHLKKSLARSFKAQVTTSDEEALALLGQAAHHRVRQLLGTGRRQNLLIFGVDAVETAYRVGKVGYLLVALDAQSAAKSSCVTDAVSKGNAAAWGTRATLGQLLGRPEVGILAVRDRGLARSLFGAIAMALLAGKRPVEASEQVVSKFFE